MLDVRRWFSDKRKRKAREEYINQLKAIEEKYVSEQKWEPSLELVCTLSETINEEFFVYDLNRLTQMKVYVGFDNVTHLFNWTELVSRYVEARELLPLDISLIGNQRTVKSIDKFLMTSGGQRYPVERFHVNLRSELMKIRSVLHDIQDPLYKDRIFSNLRPVWADIFSLIECLCLMGVEDEQ